MTATVATRPVFNLAELVTVRLAGVVLPAAANAVVGSDGRAHVRPGQGGVVLEPRMGDPASGWVGDHVEPGASIGHPDRAVDRALAVFSCVGNQAHVLDGAAAGATGTVVGKHGAVLAAFDAAVTGRLAPGDRVAIEERGVGLRVASEPELRFHSCSPELGRRLVTGRAPDGGLRVRVTTLLPARVAAAGLGMPAERFNLDLQLDALNASDPGRDLRFGDLVAIADQDHAVARRYRPGWLSIGAICHGSSVAGGHGAGFVTLLTGPTPRIALDLDARATLRELLVLPV
jgi:hypothetical protein